MTDLTPGIAPALLAALWAFAWYWRRREDRKHPPRDYDHERGDH